MTNMRMRCSSDIESNLELVNDGRQWRINAQLHGVHSTTVRCCCNEDEVPQSSIEGSICAFVLFCGDR